MNTIYLIKKAITLLEATTDNQLECASKIIDCIKDTDLHLIDEELSKLYPLIKKARFSKFYKTTSVKYLYKYIKVSAENYKKYINGEEIKIDNKQLTLWTISPEEVYYKSMKDSILVEIPTSSVKIILNINKLPELFSDSEEEKYDEYGETSDDSTDIIIEGPGIKKISRKTNLIRKSVVEEFKKLDKDSEASDMDQPDPIDENDYQFLPVNNPKESDIDPRILEFCTEWVGTNETRNQREKLFDSIKNIKIPEKLKIVNSPLLYRGFILTEDDYKNILNGKLKKLDPASITSWTTDRKMALEYAMSGGEEFYGALIEIPVAKLRHLIIIALENVYEYIEVWKHLMREKEVLIKGNYITEITKDMIIDYNDPKNHLPLKRVTYQGASPLAFDQTQCI